MGGIKLDKNSFFILGRPISPVYSGIMRLRSHLYSRDILRRISLPRPVISIGNLSMGGTGKTPHVIEISRFLVKKGLKPVILTRGYRSKAGAGPVLVRNSGPDFTPPDLVGDEPLMIAGCLSGVNVVVGSDRGKCGMWAMEHLSPDIFLLDDGFQHLAVKRDLDIVLLPFDDPLSGGHVFPGGMLREPVAALGRSDVLLLSKCPDFNGEAEALKETVHRKVLGKPIFLSSVRPVCLTRLSDNTSHPLRSLDGAKVVGFCGIARPDSFRSVLLKLGAELVNFVEFSDHHLYNRKDIDSILGILSQGRADFLVTTSKDAVKLKDFLYKDKKIVQESWSKIFVLDIGIELETGFWNYMSRFLDRI